MDNGLGPKEFLFERYAGWKGIHQGYDCARMGGGAERYRKRGSALQIRRFSACRGRFFFFILIFIFPGHVRMATLDVDCI